MAAPVDPTATAAPWATAIRMACFAGVAVVGLLAAIVSSPLYALWIPAGVALCFVERIPTRPAAGRTK